MFCPSCKALMVPQNGKFVCRLCGSKKAMGEHASASPVLVGRPEPKELKIIEKMDTLPKTKVECPECKNPEAYWRLRQTRAADEPETRIYRCVKCNHTWREY